MDILSKILELHELMQELKSSRRSGKSVVFTNGCFDILHVGHVRYLSEAKANGDILVVGLNSDASVKTIKGTYRPIVEQKQRAKVLAGLECVDYVTVFNEPDPLTLIQTIKPDVLVKGADWAEEDIVGADFVKSKGGKVVRITFMPGVSTSHIINKIMQRHQS
jgi:D-beta-D-heptose 7-phosphate kinase/D-beta-D-heptose 1-phosphate adenosyltransferase